MNIRQTITDLERAAEGLPALALLSEKLIAETGRVLEALRAVELLLAPKVEPLVQAEPALPREPALPPKDEAKRRPGRPRKAGPPVWAPKPATTKQADIEAVREEIRETRPRFDGVDAQPINPTRLPTGLASGFAKGGA